MADVAKDSFSNSLLLSREYPQSPSSISPASSRRDSSRPSHLGSGSEPPTPNSPSSSLRRKRVASLSIDATTGTRLEDLALASAGSISAIAAGEKVCLCQPDPKIPRPRNAFILYRQHYQAQVVALHPGLANPEISKIIGEQWTSQPVEVKNEWKRLAEEEKIRHQRQYPDYRYQPRRAGTTSHNRRISSSDGSIRCPKCNGRYILTPRTPSTPVTPAFRAPYDRPLPPFSSRGPTSRNMTVDDRVQFSAGHNNNARTTSSHPQNRWRPGPLQQNHGAVEMNSPRELLASVDMGASPEFKRRRFDNGPYSHPSQSPYDSPQYRSSRPQLSATGYLDGRRTQLPPGHLVQHPKGGMMEPPPRPSPAMQQFSNMSLNSPYDESLRLPPLQTQGSHFGPGQGRMNAQQRADSQARSVEAMVMTIPYINKIRVLSKISPPLAAPGPTSPIQNVRGAVIAVEGADYKLVAEVGNFIHDYLGREPECLVKVWHSSVENPEKNSALDAEMAGVEPSLTSPSTQISPYLAYLRIIQSWHARSTDIVDFITATPSPISGVSAPSPIISPATTITVPASPNPPLPPSATLTATTSTTTSTPAPLTAPTAPRSTASSSPAQAPTLPIALLPYGFSLSVSDTFASAIPITDAYAPVDHWQWMATLWRGIVGPDLTIYVKALDTTATDRDANHTDEMARFGGVECRWDVGTVVVRVASLKDGPSSLVPAPGTPRVDEKTLRRLGFEVWEWARGGMGNGGVGSRAALAGR